MTGLLHQAGCVAIGGRGVLIEGPPGSGKSSLALALIDRGAVLVSDDGVLLSVKEGRLLASPPAATRGLLEVRNVGLVAMECEDLVPVGLLLLLDRAAPRFVEDATPALRAGIALPSIALWPDSPVLALRAELALARHGLA